MSERRLVIPAVLAGSSQSEVARTHGVSQSWISRLMARYAAEGEAAFEPRSRRPRTSPRATPAKTVELVLAVRKRLSESGLDAGADTIGWHLTEPPRIDGGLPVRLRPRWEDQHRAQAVPASSGVT